METGRQIYNLEDLMKAVKSKRAVVCPDSRSWAGPRPATFMINQQGGILLKLFKAGMYLFLLKPEKCEHLDLYPSMDLQMKIMGCGHFLMHGNWECLDCGEWIVIECEDEWDGREGVKSKDGKYEFRRIDGKNKIVNILAGKFAEEEAKYE